MFAPVRVEHPLSVGGSSIRLMHLPEVAGEAGAQLWSLIGHHVPEASLTLTFFTLVLTQLQARRARRKADTEAKRASAEAKAKAVSEMKAQELDRSNKLVAALREIGEAKDAIVLDQAVTLGRTLAQTPEPVDYRIRFHSPVGAEDMYSKAPIVDTNQERFRVERKYYGNPCATIPQPPSPFSSVNSFPRDIPKEWHPVLVDAIIQTLPERFPSYHSIATANPYGQRSPHDVIRRIARLSDAVAQPYMRASQRPITEFIAGTFADHWSQLPQTIRSLLIDQDGQFLNLGSDLLSFAATGTINAHRPHLVRLAIVQGVSESIRYMHEQISADQKERLTAAYASLLSYDKLNGLGPHRLWHDSTYGDTVSWGFEETDNNVMEVGRFEPAQDHARGHLSVDQVIGSAVLAMGIVSPDSPPDPHGGAGHYTMRIVQFLPRVFDSYREDPRMIRRLANSDTAISWDSGLDYTRIDDFVTGIHKLSQRRRCQEEIHALLESASILVPDIAARIDKMNTEDVPTQ